MKYYSVHFTPPRDITVANRGNETNKTVNIPAAAPMFPPVNVGTIPGNQETALILIFGSWAMMQGQPMTIICEVDDNGDARAWSVQGNA